MNTLAKDQPWFAEDGGEFEGDEPFYFDTAAFPWVRHLEANWTVFRDELQALLARDSADLQPYANMEMTNRPGQWKTFGMMFWMHVIAENVAKCPKSWALLKDVPNICGASFNLLEPHTTIKPHHGDTNAIVRCHMGIEVPASAPRCAFRVGTEIRSWENGRFLMFCDAHEHTAWNNTDAKRYILVVDIMRPEYVSQRRSTSARVLASIQAAIYFQQVAWLKRFFGGQLGKRLVFQVLRVLARVQLATKS